MKLNITYDGQTISVADGESITLKCKGLKARGNITVSAVSDTAQPDTPTEYTLSGTWVFNEELILDHGEVPAQLITFISDGKTFYSIATFKTGVVSYWVTPASSALEERVYSTSNGWEKDYRTITFDGTQTVSQEFYSWFTANAKIQT